MVLSIFRRSLRTGIVTVDYTGAGDAVPDAYQGQVTLRTDRCTGDGACARVCPSQAIAVETDGSGWTWRLDNGRCVFCGFCAEACPEGAIRLSNAFELGVRDRADLVTQVRYSCVDRSPADEGERGHE